MLCHCQLIYFEEAAPSAPTYVERQILSTRCSLPSSGQSVSHLHHAFAPLVLIWKVAIGISVDSPETWASIPSPARAPRITPLGKYKNYVHTSSDPTPHSPTPHPGVDSPTAPVSTPPRPPSAPLACPHSFYLRPGIDCPSRRRCRDGSF